MVSTVRRTLAGLTEARKAGRECSAVSLDASGVKCREPARRSDGFWGIRSRIVGHRAVLIHLATIATGSNGDDGR